MTTKPMRFAKAEDCLQATLRCLADYLRPRDREFLEKAMRAYAELYTEEQKKDDD